MKVYNLEGKTESWLRGKLQTNILRVTFTKADGTERIMDCTTNPGHIPASTNKTGRVKLPAQGVISAVDVEINEWRSFRFDSVSNVERLEKINR